jgi:hypothetical protein
VGENTAMVANDLDKETLVRILPPTTVF